MARRLLVSCLGVNDYTAVRYAAPAGSGEAHGAEALRYIQEARVRGLRTRTPPVIVDKVVTLCTAKARAQNWDAHNGLRGRLAALGYEDDALAIEDGAQPSELWSMFRKLAGVVLPGDELYVDVTHGFRTQPLLLVTALDYVCRIQGATVVEISYGAYDAPLPNSDARQTFDLSPFLVLRDWGAAWVRFEESRDLRGLAAVFSESEAKLRRRLRGPTTLQRLARPLRELATSLRNNDLRGAPDSAREALVALRALGEELEAQEVQPFRTVLGKLEAELSKLVPADATPKARLAAQAEIADWSRRGGLYPQALTVVRESVTDLIALRLGLDPDDPQIREPLDGCAGALAALTKGQAPKVPEPLQGAWSSLVEDEAWARRVGVLADRAHDARNSVNHGWIIGSASGAKDKEGWLATRTRSCIEDLRALVSEA